MCHLLLLPQDPAPPGSAGLAAGSVIGFGGYARAVTHASDVPRLHRGIVLRVREDSCEILAADGIATAGYATQFPTPHVERVSPGNLVAVATGPDGTEVVVWRWYDAVVVADEPDGVVVWEPAHGESRARRRVPDRRYQPGTRAYVSAGLPGAEWWIAGRHVAHPDDADVELAEVAGLYTDNGLWAAAFPH